MDNLNSPPDIILYTRGTKGDLYPFLKIGAELKAKGCRITLLSNYCYEAYAEQEGFEFFALDNEASFEALNNNPEAHSSLSAKLQLSKDHIVANLEREVDILLRCSANNNVALIAHSNDYLAPLLAKEIINIPLFLCVLAPSYVYSFSLFEALLYKLSDELNEIRRRLGLPPLCEWSKWLQSFDQAFAFWPAWFSEGGDNTLPGLQHIGFLAIDSVESARLQVEIEEFIHGNEIKILITHGTSMPFNSLYFKLGIDASEKIGCKLIVSTPFRELLPVRLPANVMWVEFCPFHELLPCIDLVIHHGGIGTTREAIAHGVPQLIIGQGFDRQHNGRIVRDLGFGDSIIPKALSEKMLVDKIEYLLKISNIKIKCDQNQMLLYDKNALELFCRNVMFRRKKHSTNIFSITNESRLNPEVDGCNSQNDAPVPKKKHLTDDENVGIINRSTKDALTMSKQELLLKIIKSKKK